MSSFLRHKTPRVRKPYERDNLKRAYDACKSGMSVYRACRLYTVPESTLRDRTRHNVSIDCHVGPDTLFSQIEEYELVEHIKYMASIGYGYSMTSIRYLAADYARSLGKEVKSKDGLSTVWFYTFMKRHPDLKNVQPQKLDISRAKGASQEKIDAYFSELKGILQDHDLINAPERIYNIDETGISTQHSPPKIVCGTQAKAQAVTSPRSMNITIIGGANALGNFIPPFYIFPGKRWNDSFIEHAPNGSGGGMSESGWCNTELFEKYVTEHFAKHISINNVNDGKSTLILYDGHKSHISLTLTNWAKKNNVVLFVLPPHTSHLTQPLDVGVYGPLKSYYYSECQQHMQKNPGMNITKYEVAQLTAKPYLRAFSPENITSAFKKAGIYPFNDKSVSGEDTAPSTIYSSIQSEDVPNVVLPIPENESVVEETVTSQTRSKESTFLQSRTITALSVKPRPKKRFVPPYLCGNLMKESNIEILQKTSAKTKLISNTNTKQNTKKDKNITKTDPKPNKSELSSDNYERPSTSGVANKSGGPISLCTQTQSDTSDSEPDVNDTEKCCVCKLWAPVELKGCTSIVFVKWGKCDFCSHWVHLKYCTKVKVLRRSSIFRCPHCSLEE